MYAAHHAGTDLPPEDHELEALDSLDDLLLDLVSERAPSAPRFEGNARFLVFDLLGEGSFGEVFRAYDVQREEMVALKVLRSRTSRRVDLLREEFFFLRTLKDHRVPEAIEFFDEDPWVFFTMGVVAGQRWNTERLDLEGSCALLLGLMEVVAAMQSHRLIHRDLKPDNILVDDLGEVHVLDFGLAIFQSHQPFRGDRSGGTLAYMSPEQLRADPLTLASDVFSCGVILFEALTGELPWSHLGEFRRTPDLSALYTSALPRSLVVLCETMLSEKPAFRPAPDEIQAILDRFAAQPRRMP